MLIFDLVSPLVIGAFVAVSALAAMVHYLSGNHQKVTVTFVLLVGVVLWFGNEPFPGAIKAIVILASFLQIIWAGIAYWVRKTDLKV